MADPEATQAAGLGSTGPPHAFYRSATGPEEGHAVSSRRATRTAALIATAVTIPVVVILALAFSGGTSGSGPSAVKVTPPPAVAACGTLMASMPSSLGDLSSRTVTPASSQVRAWGDPAVVLRCGVERPAALVPGSTDPQISIAPLGSSAAGVLWDQPDVESDGTAPTVFTAVDRDVYIEVTIPAGNQQVPLPQISGLILAAFPTAVCLGQTNGAGPVIPDDQLCTHRT